MSLAFFCDDVADGLTLFVIEQGGVGQRLRTVAAGGLTSRMDESAAMAAVLFYERHSQARIPREDGLMMGLIRFPIEH